MLPPSPIAQGFPPDGSGAAQTFVGGKRAPSQGSLPVPIVLSELDPGTGAATQCSPPSPSNQPFSSRYDVREEIGRGGCGVVMRAYDRHMQRDVVIKQIIRSQDSSDESVVRFLNEARITGRLEHPGIVPVHEIGNLDDGSLFYVMKWLQGETLATIIKRYHQANRFEKQRKLHEMLSRFHQVCQTVAYAHRLKVIHRDLKPANIMIGQFGETVVLDWGLAKDLNGPPQKSDANDRDLTTNVPRSLPSAKRDKNGSSKRNRFLSKKSSAKSGDELTRTGTVMGTAAYMSPEQARGETERVNAQSDVFSLGVILYEILSGVSPFRSESVQTTLQLVSRAEVKPIRNLDRNVPRALEAIVACALQLDPRDRYIDASQLADDVENYLARGPVSAYNEPWWGRLDRMATKYSTLVRSSFLAMFLISMLSILGAARIDQSRRNEVTARIRAQQETEQKVQALEREKLAHDRALTQLKASRKATDTWLIDLSGDLQYYPGLQSIRNQLLENAKIHYRSIVDSSLSTEADRLEATLSMIRLGDIERLVNHPSEAVEYYSKARASLEELQSQEYENLAFDITLQSANATLGLALCSVDKPDSDATWGTDCAQEAARFSQSALALQPDNPDATKTWLRSQLALTRLALNENQSLNGAAILELPEKMAERLFQDNPSTSNFHLLTSILVDRARAFEKGGAIEQSIEGNQQLVKLYSSQLSRHTPRPDWLEGRANAHVLIGNGNARLMNPQSAISSYIAAQDDMQVAWDLMYEDAYYRESMALSQANLSLSLLDAGDVEQAERKLRIAISQLQDVIQKHGSSLSRIQRAAHLFTTLTVLVDDRSLDVANPEVEKLTRDSQSLLEHFASKSVPWKEWLPQWAEIQMVRTNQLIDQEKWQEAIAVVNLALDRIESLTSLESSRDESLLIMRGKLLSRRANCRRRCDDLEAARKDEIDAEACWKTCLDSTSPRIVMQAGIAWMEMVLHPRHSNAFPAEECRQLAETLTRLAPKHPVAWHWQAYAARRTGDHALARNSLNQAKLLRTQVALEDSLLELLLNTNNDHQSGDLELLDRWEQSTPRTRRSHQLIREARDHLESKHPINP